MGKIRNWFGGVEQPPIDIYQQTAEDLMAVMAAADARPAPPPASATDRLQRNLERTVSESTARAEVLRQEIAAREAELADVLRAEEAAGVALVALAGVAEGEGPPEEPVMVWPFGRRGEVSPITEDDLSAACGLALEAEMQEEPAPWLMPDDIAAEGDRAHGK